MNIRQLASHLIPTKIQSTANLYKVLAENHSPLRLLGINIPKRYKVNSDFFQSTNSLKIPENISLKAKGERDLREVDLFIGDGSKFIAKKMTFGETISEGKKLILKRIYSDFNAKSGSSRVKTIGGNAAHQEGFHFHRVVEGDINTKSTFNLNGKVEGNATNSDRGLQINRKVEGKASNTDAGVQINLRAKNSATTSKSGKQINFTTDYALNHGSQLNFHVKKSATNHPTGRQFNVKADDSVRNYDNGKQINLHVKGDASNFNYYSYQLNGKVDGASRNQGPNAKQINVLETITNTLKAIFA